MEELDLATLHIVAKIESPSSCGCPNKWNRGCHSPWSPPLDPLLHYLDCLVGPQWKTMFLDLLALDSPGESTMGQGFLKVGLWEEKGRRCNQAVKWTFKIFLKRNLKSKKQKISKDILHKSKLWSNSCLRNMINYIIFNLVSSLLVPLKNYLQLDCQTLCKKNLGKYQVLWSRLALLAWSADKHHYSWNGISDAHTHKVLLGMVALVWHLEISFSGS